ncbi:MAG: LysR family transcriptional regulator [Nitrosomonadales bacterium]|nr:LysR family transcriptional regulator [Nitrosomonadales bacterium]
MLHITLRQLQVFAAVARHLSHSRASEELYLTQPAVSMQIKQLEQVIGLPLFEQTGKQIRLTEAGNEMLRYSRNIAQQLEEMEAVFGEMKGLERGRLNITAVSTANYFMPQLLAKFIRLYPKIQVSLQVANRDAVLKQISDNAADFAIMGQPPEGADMQSEAFMQNPLVVIASPKHTLAKIRHIKPRQLAQETFLLREQGSGTRGVAERFFAGHRLPLPSHMEMDTNEAIKQSVQAGMGVGIISRHGIELELETKRLMVLDAEHFPIMRHWHIVYRKGKRLSAASQAFRQFLLTEAEALASPGGKKSGAAKRTA